MSWSRYFLCNFRAKTVSAECEEQALSDKVIHSATQCAFATSQLVACARVVAPTIETPACQEQLTSAAKQVAKTVQELLIVSETATQHSTGDGRRTLGDIHEAARQVRLPLTWGILLISLRLTLYKVIITFSPGSFTFCLIQVTSALDGLLDHVKTSPKQLQVQEHDERFDRIITSSDRLITYQGPSTDMVQQARSLARHR
jgi:talin